ncbi:NTP transferase domain-containing protein [Aureimonas fodinaquatilis]|uniref:NTP transferase domain-containing protein n=1 Tax=Aureimonas fodinaquatilis TaxID=2565783 RepID=A0A5B0DX62_9HYPH|nr:sugar phosphate nucleotidyltransferase [Aureimonas fodinaquatilis]KAA0971063.1 NTP transferase domain-containing protein [Aureimonas fodinaquatilis]
MSSDQGVGAILMAGGQGTRLRPYTTVLPKPLMPLGDRPILELLLRQLAANGVERVYVAVNYLKALIQAVVGDGSHLGMRIEYAVEDQPLGTCGPVSQVLDDMAENFLLLNGDLLTDMSFSELLTRHVSAGADATIAGVRRVTRLEYGVLDIHDNGRLAGIREKPASENILSMGVYALRREAVRPLVTPGQRLDMPDLLQKMLMTGGFVNTHITDCRWLDIGRPEDFVEAQALVEQYQYATFHEKPA